MSVFESVNNSSKSATKITKKYVKTSVDYAYLKTFYLTSLSISNVTKIVLVGGMFTIGFVFLLVALAIYLGNVFNDISLGCVAVAVLTFVFALILFALRKMVDKQVIKALSKKFFK